MAQENLLKEERERLQEQIGIEDPKETRPSRHKMIDTHMKSHELWWICKIFIGQAR